MDTLTGLNPYLTSLMDRWNTVMDIQTRRLAEQPNRDRRAFAEWEKGKRLERNLATEQADEAQVDRADARAQSWRAEKAARDAQLRAEMGRRSALNASVDRSRTLQATYGGPTGWTPSGALADFYEYGAGNPEGRGGGASTAGPISDKPGGVGSEGWADMDIENCLNNPLGPGCPGKLAAAGYVEDTVLGGPGIGTTRWTRGRR